MKKNEYKVFTREISKSVPANLVLVKNKYGWLFLENEDAQWFVNHTNQFTGDSVEDDETVIKLIVKQIKANKKALAN